jgi:hypothetical protein
MAVSLAPTVRVVTTGPTSTLKERSLDSSARHSPGIVGNFARELLPFR